MDKPFSDMYIRAGQLYRQGDAQGALRLLEQLNQAFPDTQNILLPMALCMEKLGRFEQALALCEGLIACFHDDRAMILKARILTTPGAEDQQQRMPAPPPWPDSPMLKGGTYPGIPSLSLAAGAAWKTLAVFSLAAGTFLFPFLITTYAQDSFTTPGVLPTLYPGRLLGLYALAIFLTLYLPLALWLYQCGAWTYRSAAVNLFDIALLLVFSMIPVFGWGITPVIWVKRYRQTPLQAAGMLVILLGVHLAMAWAVLALLGLASPELLWRELRAGYG